jgi:hypothetical protein
VFWNVARLYGVASQNKIIFGNLRIPRRNNLKYYKFLSVGCTVRSVLLLGSFVCVKCIWLPSNKTTADHLQSFVLWNMNSLCLNCVPTCSFLVRAFCCLVLVTASGIIRAWQSDGRMSPLCS